MSPEKPRKKEVAEGLPIYTMPGHLIRRLHQASVALFENEMRREGIDLTPVQYGALVAIAARPDLDQATLAQVIGYDRVTIGGVVDRLEAKGCVRRKVDPADRRARRLVLTAQGEAVLGGAGAAVRRVQAQILQGLSRAESEALLKLLRKSLDAVGDVTRLSRVG